MSQMGFSMFLLAAWSNESDMSLPNELSESYISPQRTLKSFPFMRYLISMVYGVFNLSLGQLK